MDSSHIVHKATAGPRQSEPKTVRPWIVEGSSVWHCFSTRVKWDLKLLATPQIGPETMWFIIIPPLNPIE